MDNLKNEGGEDETTTKNKKNKIATQREKTTYSISIKITTKDGEKTVGHRYE